MNKCVIQFACRAFARVLISIYARMFEDVGARNDRTLLLDVFDETFQERIAPDRHVVAYDGDVFLRASDRDVHASSVGEKSDEPPRVRAHRADDDALRLATLERVDGRDFDLFRILYVRQRRGEDVSE